MGIREEYNEKFKDFKESYRKRRERIKYRVRDHWFSRGVRLSLNVFVLSKENPDAAKELEEKFEVEPEIQRLTSEISEKDELYISTNCRSHSQKEAAKGDLLDSVQRLVYIQKQYKGFELEVAKMVKELELEVEDGLDVYDKAVLLLPEVQENPLLLLDDNQVPIEKVIRKKPIIYKWWNSLQRRREKSRKKENGYNDFGGE